ncbi:hypothetical protein [Candidatus Albibeggiatoa sp. nov. NOAA]|uniref:hypothetical protein n=1 Tax=Candidatus Albibeggiatoa sp. nov. NOAA TaxID=3162724 RepID=UPI0033018E1E|nr:hypothetical protein [Thiotrichaceae bacterium]
MIKRPFKTPTIVLEAIEACRQKQGKRLDLTSQFMTLPTFPPEIFSLTHLEELDLYGQVVPEEIKQLTKTY